MIRILMLAVFLFPFCNATEVDSFPKGIFLHEYSLKNDPFIGLEYKISDLSLLQKMNYQITLERIEKDKKLFIVTVFQRDQKAFNLNHNLFYINKDDLPFWFFRVWKDSYDKNAKLIPLTKVLSMPTTKKTDIISPNSNQIVATATI